MKKRFSKIYVEITNVCNLHCEFCLETNREKRIMKIQEFEHIISEIKDFTNLIMLHVKGEPLLHPELENILKICEDKDIKVNITTNTTLLEKNKEILKNSKSLRQLNLSIHDLEQNKMDTDENLRKIVEVVEELTEFNSNLLISYRLWNIEQIGKNEKNLRFINLLEKTYNKENLFEKCVENNFVELKKNVFLNQDIEFKWPNMSDEIISECGKCYGLKNQVAILVNGDVVPCCLDTNGDILLGNIFKEKFQDIINNDKSKRIIEGFNNSKLTEELCKRCGFIKKFN